MDWHYFVEYSPHSVWMCAILCIIFWTHRTLLWIWITLWWILLVLCQKDPRSTGGEGGKLIMLDHVKSVIFACDYNLHLKSPKSPRSCCPHSSWGPCDLPIAYLYQKQIMDLPRGGYDTLGKSNLIIYTFWHILLVKNGRIGHNLLISKLPAFKGSCHIVCKPAMCWGKKKKETLNCSLTILSSSLVFVFFTSTNTFKKTENNNISLSWASCLLLREHLFCFSHAKSVRA